LDFDFRRAFQSFKDAVAMLANQVYEAIFEGLGDDIEKKLPGIPWLAMCVNYYPRCPDPSVTYGSTPHRDAGSLTILLQDDVPGLWFQKNNEWIQVKPLANAFVVSIGDQVEVYQTPQFMQLSNRLYVIMLLHNMDIRL
jgi:isopenicillin N synthase-like dioxygenase